MLTLINLIFNLITLNIQTILSLFILIIIHIYNDIVYLYSYIEPKTGDYTPFSLDTSAERIILNLLFKQYANKLYSPEVLNSFWLKYPPIKDIFAKKLIL